MTLDNGRRRSRLESQDDLAYLTGQRRTEDRDAQIRSRSRETDEDHGRRSDSGPIEERWREPRSA